MVGWPIQIEQWEYSAIPESWLDHPHSIYSYESPEALTFAVSAAKYGKSLRLRYIHPQTQNIFGAMTAAEEHNGGLVPRALLNGYGWPACKQPGLDPIDVARKSEIEYFEEIWKDRLPQTQFHSAQLDGGKA